MPRLSCHTENKRLLWQHLIRMVVDKICTMTVKGVKLKSESFISISHGVLELWRKNIKGWNLSPPGPDGVKESTSHLKSRADNTIYFLFTQFGVP